MKQVQASLRLVSFVQRSQRARNYSCNQQSNLKPPYYRISKSVMTSFCYNRCLGSFDSEPRVTKSHQLQLQLLFEGDHPRLKSMSLAGMTFSIQWWAHLNQWQLPIIQRMAQLDRSRGGTAKLSGCICSSHPNVPRLNLRAAKKDFKCVLRKTSAWTVDGARTQKQR